MRNNDIYAQRREQLADLIMKLKPQRFNMRRWISDYPKEAMKSLKGRVNSWCYPKRFLYLNNGPGREGEEALDTKLLKHKAENCTTAACIAGWAVMAFPEEAEAISKKMLKGRGHLDGVDFFGNNLVPIREVARELLGLSDGESNYLFSGIFSKHRWGDLEKITRKEAANALRNLNNKYALSSDE